MKLEIKGHSGCGLDIVENEDGSLLVKKFTDNKSYFERLSTQAVKQELDDRARNTNGVSVPEIIERRLSEDGNQFYILMQYIYAKNFIDFFEHASKEDLDHVISMICEYISKELEETEMTQMKSSVFLEKLDSIESNCHKNEILNQGNNMDDVNDIITLARSIYLQMPKSFIVPLGPCHGDLTFSNLLFSKNKMYIIDYLDSFIETPIQDIAKVRQDSKYHWSLLMYDKTNRIDFIRVHMIFKYIDDRIDDYFLNCKYADYYKGLYHYFQLMNLLRILPYVKEEYVYKYLARSLKSILYQKSSWTEKSLH